jgi:hypothetical protein
MVENPKFSVRSLIYKGLIVCDFAFEMWGQSPESSVKMV